VPPGASERLAPEEALREPRPALVAAGYQPALSGDDIDLHDVGALAEGPRSRGGAVAGVVGDTEHPPDAAARRRRLRAVGLVRRASPSGCPAQAVQDGAN